MLKLFTFVLMFSFQDQDNLPKNAHTWATFVTAVGTTPETATLDPKGVFNLSWLPGRADRQVTVKVFEKAERGVVDDLPTTLAIGFDKNLQKGTRMEVKLHGVYLIQPEFYNKALEQYKALKFSETELRPGHLYKALDTFSGRDEKVLNCIHALSSIEGDLDHFARRGYRATNLVTDFFEKKGQLSTKVNYTGIAAQVLGDFYVGVETLRDARAQQIILPAAGR